MTDRFNIENDLIYHGFERVVGVDEAGRGCGAGPVVAAAVLIPSEYVQTFDESKLKDSKKMTKKAREEVFPMIHELCKVGVGVMDNRIIDEVNILEATKMAMTTAINKLAPDFALIDGNFRIPNLNVIHMPIVKGETHSLSIAAASVIAKVTRDIMMDALHREFPQYGWSKNKGYLTKDHVTAIRTYGTTPFHRLSFRKVGK
jgi:ribonuclease HII